MLADPDKTMNDLSKTLSAQHLQPQGHFPFLNLPVELRLKIYSSACVDDDFDIRLEVGSDGRVWRTRLPETNLFHVCKIVYTESLPVFYGQNLFTFELPKIPLQGWLDHIGPGKLMLKDCELRQVLYGTEDDLSIYDIWNTANVLVKHAPQLMKLYFHRDLDGAGEQSCYFMWKYFRSFAVTAAAYLQHGSFEVLVRFVEACCPDKYKEFMERCRFFQDSKARSDWVRTYYYDALEDCWPGIKIDDRVVRKNPSFGVSLRMTKDDLEALKKMKIHTESNGSWKFEKQQNKLWDVDKILALVRIPSAVEDDA